MASAAGIEVDMKLHAIYAADGEFYPATVTAISDAPRRAKKPVRVNYTGFEDEVWVSLDALKSKRLGLTGAGAKGGPAPKAKAKAEAPAPKAKAKAKVKAKAQKETEEKEKKNREPVTFTYFQLWAKGPSIALALEHSGIDWVGAFPDNWMEFKASTPWLELPMMDIPGIGAIGHEAAIFNYIGRRSKKMEGYNMKEFMVSQQLMQTGEDIYKKLGLMKGGQMSAEESAKFWVSDDPNTHNSKFGIKVYLQLLDQYYGKCNAGEGKYTKSGITVGECKLFIMLHACKLCKDDVLDGFVGVKAFYDRFVGMEKTKAVMDGTGKMPGQFKQYFGA